MRRARVWLRDPNVLLGLIVVVGIALRLVDVGNRLSHDEGYSWLVASAGSPHGFLARLAHYENTPPLFYLLLTPLPLDAEFWLRFPSLVAGVATIPVVFAIVRPMAGTKAGLLAALALAVSPFAVSYSDYSRGFMVAGLGILVALLAAQRLSSGEGWRWWLVYAAAAAWALYSEYYAALYIAAIAAALIVLRRQARARTALLGVAPFLSLLPWLGEFSRSHDDLGKTKLPFAATTPGPRVIRDAIVPLAFGEHGAAGSTSVRYTQALAVIALVVWGCVQVYRRCDRATFWLLPGVLFIAVGLQLLVTALEANIFEERYRTTVIPVAAGVLAIALVMLASSRVIRVVAAALLVLGVAIVVRRAGHEYEPDSANAVAVAESRGDRTILTNSAVVAFYGRRLHVVLDRPFGLGSGLERNCAPECAVIDDGRFGGVRPGPGPFTLLGPIVIRFPPAESPAP